MIRVKTDLGRFRVLVDTFSLDVSAALDRAARRIERGAKLRAPVDTGRLRNSIGVALNNEFSRIVFADTDYAVFVELGSRRNRAQPYLMPAVEETIPKLEDDLRRILE